MPSDDIVCVGFSARVDGSNAVAVGSGTLAGAAGAVAIGKDSTGEAASTSTVDVIKPGMRT
jgi:autotransporter adhesin